MSKACFSFGWEIPIKPGSFSQIHPPIPSEEADLEKQKELLVSEMKEQLQHTCGEPLQAINPINGSRANERGPTERFNTAPHQEFLYLDLRPCKFLVVHIARTFVWGASPLFRPEALIFMLEVMVHRKAIVLGGERIVNSLVLERTRRLRLRSITCILSLFCQLFCHSRFLVSFASCCVFFSCVCHLCCHSCSELSCFLYFVCCCF